MTTAHPMTQMAQTREMHRAKTARITDNQGDGVEEYVGAPSGATGTAAEAPELCNEMARLRQPRRQSGRIDAGRSH